MIYIYCGIILFRYCVKWMRERDGESAAKKRISLRLEVISLVVSQGPLYTKFDLVYLLIGIFTFCNLLHILLKKERRSILMYVSKLFVWPFAMKFQRIITNT